MSKRIGVLALQGDFAAHARALERVGASAREVRTTRELEGVAGLILPGGESTALLKLMEPAELEQAITDFHRAGGALFGTCAGLILLARDVVNPAQRSMGLIDCQVERNGYGRQRESFVGTGELVLEGGAQAEVEMVFIRAPRIHHCGPDVEVIATHAGEAVMVRQGRVLGATFHPELSSSVEVHRRFVDLA